MPRYHLYGFVVESDVDLPGLDAAPGADVEVTIAERPISREEFERGNQNGRRIVAEFQDLLRFSVQDGTTIGYCALRPDVPDEVLSARLLGEVMAGLLRQRGLLVVHACAVEKDGRAVAFFGESGWGKSTLAAYLCQNGYRLLTDDVMALDGIHVVPSYPQIRLRDDSAAHFGSEMQLKAITRNGPKWAHNALPMPERPVPLRALYLLEPTYRDRTYAEPVAPADAVMALVAHTRARTLVHTNAPDLLSQHLAACVALVQAVPPQQLRRRRSLDALGEILDLIESHSMVAGTDPMAYEAR